MITLFFKRKSKVNVIPYPLWDVSSWNSGKRSCRRAGETGKRITGWLESGGCPRTKTRMRGEVLTPGAAAEPWLCILAGWLLSGSCQENYRESAPREAQISLPVQSKDRAECWTLQSGSFCSMSQWPSTLLKMPFCFSSSLSPHQSLPHQAALPPSGDIFLSKCH